MKHRKKTNILLLAVWVVLSLNLVFGQDENNPPKGIEITYPENWSWESTRETEISLSPNRKAVIKRIVTQFPDLETAVDNIWPRYLQKEFTGIKELSSEEDEADGVVRILRNYRAISKTDRKSVSLTTQLAALSDDPNGSVILYIGVVKQGAGKKLQDEVFQALKTIRVFEEDTQTKSEAPVSIIPKTLPEFTTTPPNVSPAPALSTVSKPGCSGSKLSEAEIRLILKQHNEARAEVGVPPLEWSCSLANYAQEWADQGVIEHSPDERLSGIIPGSYVGENILWDGRAKQPPSVKFWLDEKLFWDNESATCQAGKVCGHYTQIVWRSTTQVGCGINKNLPDEVKTFFVCNYSPGSNSEGPAY